MEAADIVRNDGLADTSLAAALGDGVDAPYGIYVPRWWC